MCHNDKHHPHPATYVGHCAEECRVCDEHNCLIDPEHSCEPCDM
jgi:hypothetical protein